MASRRLSAKDCFEYSWTFQLDTQILEMQSKENCGDSLVSNTFTDAKATVENGHDLEG